MKTSTSPRKDERLLPLDALRGLIMMLMAIDHASLFIAKVHQSEFWNAPLPRYHDALTFLTRFVTHLCAPGFFFLMGTGMMLFAESRRRLGWSEGKIIRHFLLRGLLLIALQYLVENRAWQLGIPPGYLPTFFSGVLFGLGATMIVCSLLLRFGSIALLGLSLSAILVTQVVVTHGNTLVGYPSLLRLLLFAGRTGAWHVLYPVVPWLGIAGLGLVFGQELIHNRERAYRFAAIVGAAFLLLFALTRWLGGLGDFHPLDRPGWIAFLNVTKYPPSLAFILLTLGADLLLLALFSRAGEGLKIGGHPLLTFGRTALFFYIAHLYLYAYIGFSFPRGTSLPQMYPFWAMGLLIFYPVCWGYGKFKQRTAPDSFWRFF